MLAPLAKPVEKNREKFVAELTEAALAVAVKDGTYGTSVDLEIDLFNALAAALRDRADREGRNRAEHAWDDRLADWSDAAYRVLLRHRFHKNFIEVQLDLRHAFRHVIRRNRFLPAGTVHVADAGADSIHLSGMLAIR
jgi:hypothetical protein